MQQRIYTTEIGAHVGEPVRLAGWLHAFRRMGGINFLVLRDVRGLAQVVVDAPAALDTSTAKHSARRPQAFTAPAAS